MSEYLEEGLETQCNEFDREVRELASQYPEFFNEDNRIGDYYAWVCYDPPKVAWWPNFDDLPKWLKDTMIELYREMFEAKPETL